MAEWKLYVRNADLIEVGELETFATARIRQRLDDEGSWMIEGLKANDPIAAALEWSSSSGAQGIVLRRDGEIEMSGPVKHLGPSEDAESFQEPDGTIVPRVEASGIDDTGTLAERAIQPVWNQAGPPYLGAYDAVTSTSAESALHLFVSRHAGPAAAPYGRQIRGLEMGPNSGRGALITKGFRFTNLLVALQQIALAGDGIRFKVLQTRDGARTFLTEGFNDLRSRVRLSVGGDGGAGNLAAITSSEDAASANYVYGAFKGELEDRIVVERSDPESMARYGRIEHVHSEGNIDDPTEISNAMAKALEEGREDLAFDVEAIEDEDVEYGRDYRLGDRLTVVLADGREIEGYVVEVTIDLTPAGAIVTPVVATTRVAPSSRDPVRALGQRLGHLERTNENGFTIGMVIPWMRAIAEIPAGFELADGSLGLPNMTDRFWFGAGGSVLVGGVAGLPFVGGDVQVNLLHGHTVPDHGHAVADHDHGPGSLVFPHTHSHSHGPGSLGFPHTHSHGHGPGTLGFPHTHSHGHGPGTLAFPHDHDHDHAPGDLSFPHTHPGSHSHGITNFNIAHTHASQAHTHPGSHSHGIADHNHVTDINHDHPAFNSGTSAGGIIVQSGTGAGAANTTHVHQIDVAALGASPVASGNQSSGGSTTQTDSNAHAASYTGVPSDPSPFDFDGTTDTDSNAHAASFGTATGTTDNDATAATFGTATGAAATDATAATFGASTGTSATDATAATPGTASGVTDTDATAATFGAATGTTATKTELTTDNETGVSTGNSLASTSVLNPLVGVLPIYRTV